MPIKLEIKDRRVVGEVTLSVPPGTVAAELERQVSGAIKDALHDAAAQLGVVLAASAYKFVKPAAGKNADGQNRYAIRGRAEGGRLIPDFSVPKRSKP